MFKATALLILAVAISVKSIENFEFNHFQLGTLSPNSILINRENVTFQQNPKHPVLFEYEYSTEKIIGKIEALDLNGNGGKVVYYNDGIGTSQIFLFFDGPSTIEFLINIYSY